jgi:CHAT domain-containing protein
MRRPILALFALLWLNRATTADENPAAVAEAFYRAFAEGNTTAARELWAPDEAAKFDRRWARSMRVRCMQLHDLETRIASSDGSNADVELDADLTSWSDFPGDRGRTEHVRLRITLRRHEGAWKITGWREPEQDVAEAIVAGAPWRELLACAEEEHIRPRVLVRWLTRRSVPRFLHNDDREAWRINDLALDIARTTGDTDALAEVIGARSILEGRQDQPRAYQSALEALDLAQRGGNPDVIARGFLRVGRAEQSSKWNENYEQMLAMADFVESYVTLANAATNLAGYHSGRGSYHKSLSYAIESQRYADAAGEKISQYTTLLNFGAAYQGQGDHEIAIPYWEQALELGRELQIGPALSHPLRSLSISLSAAGRMAEAFACLDEAMGVGADTDVIRFARASLFADQGELTCAKAEIFDVLHTRPDSPQDTALMYLRLSGLAMQERSYQEALDLGVIGVEISMLDGNDYGHVYVARALRALGRLEEAEHFYRLTLEQPGNTLASAVPDLRQLAKFTASRSGNTVELAEVLVDLGRPADAIEVIENMRGRILREYDSGAIPQPGGVDRADRIQLERRIVDLNTALLRAPESKRQKLREALTLARLDLQRFLAQSAVADRAPRSHAPKHETFPELRDTAIIEYLVSTERMTALTIVYDEDGRRHVDATVLAAEPAKIARAVDTLLGAIERRDFSTDQHARFLYERLLQPLEEKLGGSKSLCVIPDGVLWRLPFHALRARDGRYLGDRHTLYYSPSLAFLAMPREEPKERSIELLALANASVGSGARATVRAVYRDARLGALPDAEREVGQIRRMYDTQSSYAYVGRKATEAVFKESAAQSRILHIATHGILDDESPMYSALLLASSGGHLEDGLLEAREIASLDLHADVAVLSACETGRGRFEAGEGIVGMAWAFLAAGCPTTVVSQWKAQSKATAELMVEFHRHLSRGVKPAVALQRATQTLRANPRYAHPLYWAPFIVVGAN